MMPSLTVQPRVVVGPWTAGGRAGRRQLGPRPRSGGRVLTGEQVGLCAGDPVVADVHTQGRVPVVASGPRTEPRATRACACACGVRRRTPRTNEPAHSAMTRPTDHGGMRRHRPRRGRRKCARRRVGGGHPSLTPQLVQTARLSRRSALRARLHCSHPRAMTTTRRPAWGRPPRSLPALQHRSMRRRNTPSTGLSSPATPG